jgi:Ca2+/Na+ antiporter
LFSIIFAKCKKDIGSIYGADLVGAGVGCLIVPVLFHFIDLPFIIGVFLLFFCLITTFFLGRFTVKNTYILIVYLMLFVGFLVLFESSYDLAGTIRHVFQNKGAVTEISHRWNEFSRVALLKIQGRLLPQYHIIHDNGESNVGVVLKQPRFDGHSV